MKTIYALNNGAGRLISDFSFFANEELAKIALRQIKKDRRNKPGVEVIKDTDTEFQFIIGWEEHQVSFRIQPIEVKEI